MIHRYFFIQLVKVGISFSKVDEPYSQFTSNIDMMILTEKIVEIPGDGVITAFECLVNDHTSEAKFGVVKQFSPGRYIIKCITEAKGNDHYPLLMDFVNSLVKILYNFQGRAR